MDNLTLVKQATEGLVLTANKRLAATLTQRFDQFMADRSTCWERPAILPLGAWLLGYSRLLNLEGQLLNEVQERRAWEEILEEDQAGRGLPGLLQLTATAETAASANRLLLQYCCEPGPGPHSDDVAAFCRWRREWQHRSRSRNWLSQAELPRLVAAALREGRLEAPAQLTLVGFDLLPPVFEEVLAACTTRGCRVIIAEEQAAPAGSLLRWQAADPIEEVRACARWVRRQLEVNPEARIGIVAPALGEYQAMLSRTLLGELAPTQTLEFGGGHPAEFSLGGTLLDEGPVRLALELFGLGKRVELALAGWLLRSPFLAGWSGEADARAGIDRMLRRKGQSVLPLGRLSRLVSGTQKTPVFLDILHHLQAWTDDRRKRKPGVWSERMAALLETVGWPGDGSLGSREFQLVEKFTQVLQRLSSLDMVSRPIDRATAVGLLRQIVRETEFQVEEAPSKVQVLGLLEAGGQQFDALWIVGMHDTACPVPARPNPFLPLALQREHRMPHADAARELEFARQACGRLFSAAASVVVSWPGMIDGAECRPSPLLVSIPDGEPDLAASCDPRDVLLAAGRLETWQDFIGPGIPAGVPFKGGTGILKDQALCPFRAFAHFRLFAEGLEVPDIGLDPMCRGSLVHGVLEHFWRRNPDQADLLAMEADAQERELALCAEQALAEFERREHRDLPVRQRALEQQRLTRVAATWLERERERTPFVVDTTEQGRTVTIGGLSIRTRIDRIDRLDNGRLLVIDYKTGRPDVSQWYDERVSEPQMPIYCYDIPPQQVGGALFARVHCRQDETGFYGLLHPECGWNDRWQKDLDRVLAEHGWDNFEAILEHWRTTLEKTANDFVAGRAEVDPVDRQKACRYCDLLAFCRRLEHDLAIEETEHD